MTTKRIENCNYCSPSGVKCSEAVQPGEKKCLWHNFPSSNESPIKEKIEEMVREDHSLAGFNLKKADLQDAGLIGADLEHADLSRADLTGAHLYGANLQGANLFKANLSFWQVDLPVGEILYNLLYFSAVVFTTVGFGDITPTGASKGVMMLQGLSGQILIAFFIVALYKKLMSR